jgi:hypothetical protein
MHDSRSQRFKLGFHTRVPYPLGGAAQALQDGIALFQEAEQLGYDRGWVYQRHFDNYMAAPLVFLPVVAQHTERISVGTAIIGVRYGIRSSWPRRPRPPTTSAAAGSSSGWPRAWAASTSPSARRPTTAASSR